MNKPLKRKIDTYLREWKSRQDHKPLIVKGARQVGKTFSIESFAAANYRHTIAINFVEQPQYKSIFDNGYDVDSILKNISLINPRQVFVPHETLFFFDELQSCPACATSLKFFCLDSRFDVICSGSLMGINYARIESNSVGYKEDYEMHSMDFEEFLWAKGYPGTLIDEMLGHMLAVKPFSDLELETFFAVFRDYMVLGGMPAVVSKYIEQNNFSGILNLQRQLLQDYEEDITKYAQGLDKSKIKAIYSNISIFLAKDNKRFLITKIARNARNREYVGCVEWLTDAGIVNPCYCIDNLELPLKGNHDTSQYKLYYKDTGLLIAALDEEAQEDLRNNRNFGTYKGAIFENIVADMLAKQSYGLYYYKRDKPSIEMDFFVCNAHSLIPIEVKSGNSTSPSLNQLLSNDKYPEITFGIKFAQTNIGFNSRHYSFPYFLAFLLRRFLTQRTQLLCK